MFDGRATDDGFMRLLIIALLIGVVIGGGCTLFATSGCMPTIRVEWNEQAEPADS